MMILGSTRLLLRLVELSDQVQIFAYRSDPEICRYQSWKPGTLEEVADFINAKIVREPNIPGTWMQLAICRKEDNGVIGDCGIHFLEAEPEQVEIGITISKANQGRGYGAETLSTVFRYLFGELKKHRIVASVDPANCASKKLMEKVNMRQEAHFRKSIRIDGEWVDDVVFAILAEEWNANQSPTD